MSSELALERRYFEILYVGQMDLLAVAGATQEFLLIDPITGKTLQTTPLSFISHEVRTNRTTNVTASAVSNTQSNTTSIVSVTNKAELSLTGLIFSPDCRRLHQHSRTGCAAWR